MAIADIQTSLNAGELSPGLYARVDLDKFQTGAALLRNFYVDYRGGVSNRPGTKFIAGVEQDSRLIPFIVSTSAAYVLVFSDLLITIFTAGELVTTVATPYLSADLFAISYTQSADVLTLVHPSYPPANLSRTSDTTFVYAVLTTAPITNPPVVTTMVAPHSGPYSFGYLVTAVDLDGKEESLPSNPAVKHSEGMNEMTNRVVGLSWDAPLDDDSNPQPVSRYNVYKWGPIDAVTLNPATVWGFIGSSQTTTFTDNNIAADFSKQPPGWGDPFSGGQFQSITVDAPGSGYDGVSGDWPVIPYVPLVISGDGTGAAGYAVIDHALGTIIGVYMTNPGKNYTHATITATGEGGTGATFLFTFSDPLPLNPAATAYLQQRRVFGGANLKPETIVMSQTGLYNNFNTTPVSLATDAIVMSIAGSQVNTIKHLVPVSYGMLTFTTGGSLLVSGGTPGAVISPATVSFQAQASEGANDLRPLTINYDVLYGQAKGNRIRNLAFAWQRQSYTGSDISTLAAHLFDTFRTVDWAWAEEPFKLVWAVRDDGKMLSLTYVPDQEVYAWCRHDTQGEFKSVCSVPEGATDAVYVIVRRFIPSVAGFGVCEGYAWYLERFDDRTTDCLEQSWFVDCAKRLPLTPGNSHLWFEAATGDTVMKLCSDVSTLGVHFDGAAAIRNASLTSTDTSALSYSYWVRVDFTAATPFVWSSDQEGDNNAFHHSTSARSGTATALVQKVELSGSASILKAGSNSANYNNSWHHVLVSGSLNGSGDIKVYIDGEDQTTGVFSSGSGGPIVFNGLSFLIGAFLVPGTPWPEGYSVFDLAQFWFAPGRSLLTAGDITPTTLAKFYSPDGPQYLGADGSLPLGVAPAIYLNIGIGDTVADFLVNKGTGGDFVDAGTSPIRLSETQPPAVGPVFPYPVILGVPAVGEELSLDLSSWPRAIISATYQWYDSDNSTLATTATYVVDIAESGKTINCVVYITDADGLWVAPSSGNGTEFGPIA